MSSKLWGGRFKKRIDPDFEKFSASLQWDHRLLPYDLAVGKAHVRALKKCGVLSPAEAKKMLSAFAFLDSRYQRGKIRIPSGEEDVHSAVQSLLRSRVGALADKLHTGRSRNDLVAQSSRLYCKAHGQTIIALVDELRKAFVAKAEQTQDVLVPGMTHLQNAQILSQAHIFLAYVEMLTRTRAGFEEAVKLSDVCVLGSGALAGITFNLDQKGIAKELGLFSVTTNSYDVSGDRDFALRLLSTIFYGSLQLSRIAEDLMIGQTRGFGLVEFDQSFCTGSSMMPQKKKRGFCGAFAGSFWRFRG